MVAERNPAGRMPGVKCNHVAARTMEIFRRLGIASGRFAIPACQRIMPTTLRSVRRRPGSSSRRIMIPCRRDRYTNKDGPDGWWPTPEPPHRINQIYLDPLLADFAQGATAHPLRQPTGSRRGSPKPEDGVTAETVDANGARDHRALCLSDGLRWSIVSHRHLDRRAADRRCVHRPHAIHLCPGSGPGGQNAGAAGLVDAGHEPAAQRQHVRGGWARDLADPQLSAADETDFDAIDSDWCIRAIMGVDTDFPYEVITRENWIGRRLLADRFRDRRAFICGDAAHLWVPSAGYGMKPASPTR